MTDTATTTGKPRLALLIDADNTAPKYLQIIMNEIPKHGVATYRRIYGDFTDQQMASWRAKLLDNSIMPVQQFSNVKHHKPGEKAGKNATDSTLIIDAMDILYAGKVDGFVIVSSDSDFTRLATRLRESNMTVIGMGRNQTPVSFRHACTKFVNLEALYDLDAKGSEEAAQKRLEADELVTTVTLDDVARVVRGVIRDNDNKGRPTPLADVGNSLSNKYPDFDVRTFGYSRLSTLIEELGAFTLVKNDSIVLVSLADAGAGAADVGDFMRSAVTEAGGQMSIGDLASQVYAEFDGFNIKDTGYSQFYKFADSISGLKVTGTSHQDVSAD